jgi:hypothetical protein
MTQPTNTFDQYDAIGNREDLSDIIYNISPMDVPFMTAIGRGAASNVLHEWQSDSLAAADDTNAQIPGDDATGDSVSATTRLNNRCQISRKTVTIAGSQQAANSAGRSNEMAYQMAKRAKELKRDMEKILTGNQASVTGSATIAPKLRSLESWYSTNTSRGGSGASGSTTQAATDGTQRAFTEELLQTVLQSCYTNGGEPNMLMVGPFNRRRVSGFTGNASRTIDASEKKLLASISVYESDFGSLKVVTNRFSRDRTAHALQTDLFATDFYRPFKTMDLAKTGDSDKKMIITEYTLKVGNEAGSGVIADLTTS